MIISDYISKIAKIHSSGKATEHSYRAALAELLEKTLPDDVSVTNEPKRIECGAPDYIVHKSEIPIGYIEAKDVPVSLDKIENETRPEAQIQRYTRSLDNFILTDYLEFRFFRKGEKIHTVKIAEIRNNRIYPLPQKHGLLLALLKDFSEHQDQTIKSSEDLAEIMANKAQLMREVFYHALITEDKDRNTSLKEQLNAFQKILIRDLDEKKFADIYAQTIAYGLFAARLYHNEKKIFLRKTAVYSIPRSNPFLLDLFDYIAGPKLDTRVTWIVDDLAKILQHVDVKSVLGTNQNQDFMIHFYENFLSKYDPALRERRGVYYTPTPVVNFIVRAADEILKKEFKIQDGIANTSKVKMKLKNEAQKEIEKEFHKVQILDPATGTGTFLAEIITQIQKKFKGQAGIWNNYIEEHIKPRVNGFEVLMASYAMCHLKLDMLLQKSGYKAEENTKRFHVFLTNSLEDIPIYKGDLYTNWLAKEANQASQIKRDTPVMVVIGNPPYSGHSANPSLIRDEKDLLDDYKFEPGGKEKLKERNAKWINDDYVKFIRYGQYFVEKNKEGVLAYINNHSFLDNPTFRGMRWHLLQNFDKIYIIDLHGNVKKKEVSPDGSIDKNVFDIQQGVCINLFIKTNKKKAGSLAKVLHYDLYGKREFKYEFLKKHNLNQIDFKELKPAEEDYLLVPQDLSNKNKYKKGFALNNLFPVNSVGIVTARDHFTIHESKEKVKKTIDSFLLIDDEQARAKFKLGKDVRDWKVHLARADLQKDRGPDFKKITKISYRPFDVKYTYYTGRSKGFHCMPRGNVMQHFLAGENVGLISLRQVKASPSYQHSFITNSIQEACLVSNKTAEISYCFPLYCFPQRKQLNFGKSREPNFNNEIIEQIAKKSNLNFTLEENSSRKNFTPIDLMDYIYAVLHSPNYRKKYYEFLKRDFPRIPYPKDKGVFWNLVKLGSQLRELHLLKSPKINKTITRFPVSGKNEVKKVSYTEEQNGKGKVYINEKQYFGKVPKTAWEFYIGGYQPAQKWLKDRKEHKLSYDDVMHYQKIIVSLTETDEIMQKINKVKKF